MSTIEIQSTTTTDDIEVRQDEFVKNRRIVETQIDLISDPVLTEAERGEAKSKLIQHAMKNIQAAEADPRVVDKVIDLPRPSDESSEE